MTVYVVGLDGADWSLLRDGIDDGSLPGFARLVDEGISGGLESTLPPITFPAWKCYSTGKTPGKLGVYEWFAFDRGGPEIVTNDSSDFRSREYWDVLVDEGFAPAVVNMPTTHPPNTDDGVLTIAGSPASERGEFTSPESLKDELFEAVPDYRTKPDLVLDEASPDELVEEAKHLADQRFDAAEWLAREKGCDLVHLTVFVTDTVQHRLWDHPEHIRDLYELIDARLGDLLDAVEADEESEDGETDADPEAVFLMSDHGFTEIDETFLVNQWLLDRGDLVLGDSTGRGALASVGITQERMKRLVGRLGLVNFAQSMVPESVQRFFPSESGRTAIQDAPIDWRRTKAISLGRGPIYINRDAFPSGAAAETYRNSLMEDIYKLRTPDGGQVAAEVHSPAEIYSGDMPRAPDFVVEYAEGVDAPEAVGGEIFGERTEWLATHRRTGIFGAWGTDISGDGGGVAPSIYDLAPTILHYLGVSVPLDVDGDVRFDVFTGDAAERTVERGPATDRSAGGARAGEEVEETLRNLGYME